MWTYDELIATAYVFYRGKLNTLTIAKLLVELHIKDKKMNKLAGKFIVDSNCQVKFAEGIGIKDIIKFINPELFAHLVSNSNVSLRDYLYAILAIKDNDTKDMLLEKFFRLIEFNNIYLGETESKQKIKG